MKKKRNRKINKGSILNVRIADRLRYGAELVARRRGESLTNVVGRAMSLLLEKEGFDERGPGETLTMLDRLWSPDPAERLLHLYEQTPELLTEEERDALSNAEAYFGEAGLEYDRKEFAQKAITELITTSTQVAQVNQILNDVASSDE